jgi:3-deoxy-manno-octulosonate cytidylyltransferase (CMP-KDO synthetase)
MGRSLLERVWRIGRAVQGVSKVLVATDDARIVEHVRSFGGEAVMTSESCTNGSERAHEAVQNIGSKADVVVNLQGDAVLMPPWVIGALVNAMKEDPSVQIATPAVRLSAEQYKSMSAIKGAGIVSGTTVTFAKNGNALYFSKGIIPFMRSAPASGEPPIFQHIGVYAYRAAALKAYINLPRGMFEEVEQLEQLRAIESGMPIRVVQVSLQGRTMWSVDNPQDVARVEEVIRAEGELV